MLRVAVMLFWVWASMARALDMSEASIELTQGLVFFPFTGGSAIEMAESYQLGSFSPDFSVSQYEANHAPEVWAALELEGPANGRLVLQLPLVSEVDIYVLQGDSVKTVLSYSVFASFDQAEHAGAWLRSAPIGLIDEERILVLAHIKLGPLHQLDLRFETDAAIAHRAATDTGWTTAFYVFGVASILVFVALFAALTEWASLFYALLFAVGLALLAFADGLLFRFVYPNRPELQSAVGFFLLFALSVAGLLLSGQGYRETGKLRMAQLCAGLAALSVGGFLASLLSPGTYVAGLGFALMVVTCILVMSGTRTVQAGTSGRLGRSLAVIAAIGIAGLLIMQLLPSSQRMLDILPTAKAIYLILLLSSLINFVARVIAVRRAKEAATQAEMAALTREASLAQELLIAEQNYSHAQNLAQTRKRKLATASHDLHQPLMSLRMTVDSLAERLDPDSRARLGEAFDYIASLSGSYLNDATDSATEPEHDDPYPISIIQQTVEQMFRDEAAAKGLRLNVVPDSVEVTIPALDLMRITSNLVTNAIKYTNAGEVSITVRQGACPQLVIKDTGPGMNPDEIALFQQEGMKGDASDGHGLGLAVCFELAEKNKLKLDITSSPGVGTTFVLDLNEVFTL